MKKLIISILLGLTLVVGIDSAEATRPLIPKPDFLPGPESITKEGQIVSGAETQNIILNQTIPTAINIILGSLAIVTFLAVLIASINLLMAWGNEDKVSKAKKTVQYALLGFILSLLSYAIVAIIVSVALPRETAYKENFIASLIPSAYANESKLDALLPNQYELVESQGGTDGRGVALPSGDLISEVLPAIVTNIIFVVGFLIFIGFTYGGVLMVYGRGNEEMITKAKDIVIYSAIALGLLGFGYGLVYGIATLNFNKSSSNIDDVYVETNE